MEGDIHEAFRNSARLLRAGGLLLLTVPWVWGGRACDALPELNDWTLRKNGAGWEIVNRAAEGLVQTFSDLSIDGRPGPCLHHTREHFPELRDWSLVREGERLVLRNKRRDGTEERFENLVFHGGPGLALEMRLFTRESLQANLTGAGFSDIRFETDDQPDIGIVFSYPWSRPLSARR